MKKFILFISIIMALFLSITVCAEDCNIECSTEVTGQVVCISGRITNVTESHQMTLLLGDVDNILYIDQKTTEGDGSFSFAFRLADKVPSGSYNFKIGSSANIEPYEGILEYTASRITCQIAINGCNVNISGLICDASSTNSVSVTLRDGSEVIYTGQTTSTENGKFNFSFELPITLPSGSYNFTIDTDAGIESYDGILMYESAVEVIESQFFDGDITVSVSNYIPTILGNVSCVDGKEINFNVINSSDNTLIAQDTVTSEDGIYNLNYVLPSLITGKDYKVTISCVNETKCLFRVDVEINSAIILVEISGDIQVAENVKLKSNVHTTNFNLINKNITITSNRSISTTIPNLVANMSCNMYVQAIEMVEKKNPNHLFTQDEKLKIEWFYKAIVERFYFAGGNLYKFEVGTETKILENAEAKFIVSDETYLYFSNMRENGKIYRCNKDGSNMRLVSEDSGSWLYIKDGYLYYKDNGNNREEKYVSISAE